MKQEKEPLPNGEKKPVNSLPQYPLHTLKVLDAAFIAIKVIPISVFLFLTVYRANSAQLKNRHHKNAFILTIKRLCRGGNG